jgi:predicted transcriptional regulator
MDAMEVQLSAEQQARLAEIATKAGTDPQRLAKDVLVRYLDEETLFLAAVERGMAAAERGEFIDEEDMDLRIERMFKP